MKFNKKSIFVFILALGDFVTPQLVGGTSGFTYGKIIYSNFGMAFNWPFGAALASILLFVSVIIIALTNYLTKKLNYFSKYKFKKSIIILIFNCHFTIFF